VRVGLFQRRKNRAHIVHEFRFGQELVKGQCPRKDFFLLEFPAAAFQFQVARGKNIEREIRYIPHHVLERTRHMLIGFKIQNIGFMLGIFADIFRTYFRPPARRVQRHDPGIIVIDPVHGPGAQTKNQPQQPGLGIDFGIPDKRVERKTNARDLRKKFVRVNRAGNPLDQKRHLLVAVQQAPMRTIGERLFAHSAGVNRADRVHKILEPFLRRALVHAKNTFVFSRERIAVSVLQQAGRAHDDRQLSEIFQHAHKLVLDILRKFSG